MRTHSMNKKTIITLLVIGIILVGGCFGLVEYLSYKTVHIVFKRDDLAITIYKDNNKKKADVSSSSDIMLKKGTYYYTPTTDVFSHDKVYFTINSDDTTVEISPAYSSARLSTLLSQDTATIHTILTSSYSMMSNYVIADETLYHHGEWYSARLIERVTGSNEPDVYRVILQKNNDTWKIVASPRLVISIKDFPNIPDYVIRQVNKAPSTQALDSSRAS